MWEKYGVSQGAVPPDRICFISEGSADLNCLPCEAQPTTGLRNLPTVLETSSYAANLNVIFGGMVHTWTTASRFPSSPIYHYRHGLFQREGRTCDGGK